jgi:hypothetical protein
MTLTSLVSKTIEYVSHIDATPVGGEDSIIIRFSDGSRAVISANKSKLLEIARLDIQLE